MRYNAIMTVASILSTLVFLFMPAQTTLYSSDLTPVVTLPAGYFCILSDGEEKAGYTAVMYDDLIGYVKSDAVTAVDYTPVNKYETNVQFRCDNDGQPVNLRSAPRKSAGIITVLPATATGHSYGAVNGDVLMTGGGDVWYYVRYDGVRGYCYYAHISVDPTPPNVIEKEPDEVFDEPTSTPPAEDETQGLPRYAAILLIVALCIPVPIIMFYLFRKPKER